MTRWSWPATVGLLGAKGVLPEALATRLRRAVGLRNLLVHEYGRIDHALVFDAAANHLDDLVRGAETIARFVSPGSA